jgi:membrane-bound ClpP family serine protease
MAKKRNKESAGLIAFGMAFLGVGLFLSYGIVMFAGVVMMVAGLLPATGKEDDPI